MLQPRNGDFGAVGLSSTLSEPQIMKCTIVRASMDRLLAMHGPLVAAAENLNASAQTSAQNASKLVPATGVQFIDKPDVRIAHPGFEVTGDPDCEMFRKAGRATYRMWWTTREYDDQKKTEGEHGTVFAAGRITYRTERDLIQLNDRRWRAYTLIDGERVGTTY